MKIPMQFKPLNQQSNATAKINGVHESGIACTLCKKACSLLPFGAKSLCEAACNRTVC